MLFQALSGKCKYRLFKAFEQTRTAVKTVFSGMFSGHLNKEVQPIQLLSVSKESKEYSLQL